jgi:vacuolar-type H+-ATPase subunit E/Vma4
VTPGELRLVKGLNDVETLAKLFPGATPDAVADLDLGSNNYLTPFSAEQTQRQQQARKQAHRQARRQARKQVREQVRKQVRRQLTREPR